LTYACCTADGLDGSQYSMKNFFRRDLARLVMNTFAWGTGFLRNRHQCVAVKISKPEDPAKPRLLVSVRGVGYRFDG